MGINIFSRRPKFMVGFFVFIFITTMTIQPLVFTALATPGDLSITCDNVSISGNTWTFSGTWQAVDFPGQSTAYDTAMFSPTATLADGSSKDSPDTFQIITSPTEFAGNPHNPDMSGIWSNQVTFATTPSAIFSTLYHQAVPGHESSGDAVCAFILPPTLTLQKTVVKNNGGTAVDTDWTLSASGPTPISGTEGNSAITNATVNAGTYVLSESNGPSGYTASQFSCIKNGGLPVNGNSITLAVGDNAVCTITNDDDAPTTGTLHVVKVLPNNNGGTATADQFSFSVNGGNTVAFESDGQNDLQVNVGTYSVVETNPMTGYTLSYNNCSNIVIPGGGEATCTITNDDIAPTVKVFKTVTNDNGGTAIAGGFGFSLDSVLQIFHNIAAITTAGPHTVSENTFLGYLPSLWGGACNSNGTINLIPGQDATCTITNDDEAPSLTLDKVIIGGTQPESTWTLTATGDQVTPVILSGQGSAGSSDIVSDSTFQAGTYTLSETGPDGYAPSGWTCIGSGSQNGDQITLEVGQNATCTITNSFIPPGTIVIVKDTIGGDDAFNFESEELGSFSITTNGGSGSETFSNLEPNTYSVSEIEPLPENWEATDVSCDNGDDPSEIDLGADETIICTFTNTYTKGTLIVEKVLPNDNGGTANPEDFSFQVNGDEPITFEGDGINELTVDIGNYTVTELEIEGYTTTLSEDCTGVEVGPGETATCTITNDDNESNDPDLTPPHSTFDNPRDNYPIIETELISLSLTGTSVDLPTINPSGVASAEMRIYQLADEATMLSDSFFDITYREMSCLNIPQEQIPIEIVALSLTSVDPLPVTVTWDYKNQLDSENNSDWTIPGRGVYCAVVHATDIAGNIENTGTAGPFAYNPQASPSPTPTLTPTPTPTPTPEPSNEPTPTPTPNGGGGGGGGGARGDFINGPLANPPQVAGASIVATPTPTPQVAGAMTVLPATGASMFDRILLSLFTALMLTGALMLLVGYKMLPKAILRKIR